MPAGIVVADTGPLPRPDLPGRRAATAVRRCCCAGIVAGELRHPHTPDPVRAWADNPPPWLAVHDNPAAITLAHALGAGLLLIDDRAGAAAARGEGLRVTGTIGVLVDAAHQRLIQLDAAFAALRATNFHYPPALIEALLVKHRRPGSVS